ncbi:MAG: hypothetical protein LC126_00490 [Bryobacterales bacterium]|nr:hypothetical protein [Bryobacterales bacterium]
MQDINRRDLLRLGMGLGAAALAPQVVSAAGRMRFSKYEILPTSIPMAERVRAAWEESYRLQGSFQTHYSAVIVRLHTDEGLVGTGESLVSAAQTEAILKRMMGHSPVDYWQDDSIQGVLMACTMFLARQRASPSPGSSLLRPSSESSIRGGLTAFRRT